MRTFLRGRLTVYQAAPYRSDVGLCRKLLQISEKYPFPHHKFPRQCWRYFLRLFQLTAPLRLCHIHHVRLRKLSHQASRVRPCPSCPAFLRVEILVGRSSSKATASANRRSFRLGTVRSLRHQVRDTEPPHHLQTSTRTHWKKQLLAVIDSDTFAVGSISEMANVIEADKLKREPFNMKATEHKSDLDFFYRTLTYP